MLLGVRKGSFIEPAGSAVTTHQLGDIRRVVSHRWSRWLTVGNDMGALDKAVLTALFSLITGLGFVTLSDKLIVVM